MYIQNFIQSSHCMQVNFIQSFVNGSVLLRAINNKNQNKIDGPVFDVRATTARICTDAKRNLYKVQLHSCHSCICMQCTLTKYFDVCRNAVNVEVYMTAQQWYIIVYLYEIERKRVQYLDIIESCAIMNDTNMENSRSGT